MTAAYTSGERPETTKPTEPTAVRVHGVADLTARAASALLPRGTVRERYQQEHHAELAALAPRKQARYSLGVVLTAWSLRQATTSTEVTMPSPRTRHPKTASLPTEPALRVDLEEPATAADTELRTLRKGPRRWRSRANIHCELTLDSQTKGAGTTQRLQSHKRAQPDQKCDRHAHLGAV